MWPRHTAAVLRHHSPPATSGAPPPKPSLPFASPRYTEHVEPDLAAGELTAGENGSVSVPSLPRLTDQWGRLTTGPARQPHDGLWTGFIQLWTEEFKTDFCFSFLFLKKKFYLDSLGIST